MKQASRAFGATFGVASLLICSALAFGPTSAQEPERDLGNVQPKTVVKGAYTSIGSLGLGMTNLGWFGNLLNPTLDWPSCEYPLNSNVEHMFLAGIWVAGIDSEGRVLVSAGAEDTGSSSTSPKQEFGPRPEDRVVLLSNNPLSPNFSTAALADQHYELTFDDPGEKRDL